ncbi:MAG: hypothetical protein WC438_04965 [Candidatus Pacearchaeota archaeon]
MKKELSDKTGPEMDPHIPKQTKYEKFKHILSEPTGILLTGIAIITIPTAIYYGYSYIKDYLETLK